MVFRTLPYRQVTEPRAGVTISVHRFDGVDPEEVEEIDAARARRIARDDPATG